ncbi:MAG TPA: hypothetical protein VH372_16825 [Actinospica sp.]|nr:hypothetical protein [Actinospica sp.]
MAVEISPGTTSGRMTRKNAPTRVQPSTIAASSSSAGTPATKPRRVQMQNGSVSASRPMIRPSRLSERPTLV